MQIRKPPCPKLRENKEQGQEFQPQIYQMLRPLTESFVLGVKNLKTKVGKNGYSAHWLPSLKGILAHYDGDYPCCVYW